MPTAQSSSLRAGLIKRLHVDQAVIRSNRKTGADNPPITVQVRGGPLKCRVAKILGPSELIYRPEKPLSCGARLWVETKAEVEVMV